MNQSFPDLKQPHSLVRSRTPEQRNAERAERFQAKIIQKENLTAAKNAQVRAGTGVEVHGPMVTARGRGKSNTTGDLEVIINSNGTAVFATISGTITGEVPGE